MKRNPDSVRSSDERWGKLFLLLRSFERAIEASSRLDAYLPRLDRKGRETDVSPALYEQFVSFDRRLVGIERRIDLEFDRLSSDRLRVDLALKIQMAAA